MAIRLKRSGAAGKVPTTVQLGLGELAINTFDGRPRNWRCRRTDRP